MTFDRITLGSALATGALALALHAQTAPGEVESSLKLGAWQGGLLAELPVDGKFGTDVALIGDLDGDGLPEVAVGSPRDPAGGPWRGAVWVLFLNTDGSVRQWQRIAGGEGGFADVVHDYDQFGDEVAGLGDVDGDGVPDLGVGAPFADEGGSDRGAFWILLLAPDGTVKHSVKHSGLTGGFGGELHDGDRFGQGLASLGDLGQDGSLELAVGSPSHDAVGDHTGAIWIVSLDDDLSISSWRRITTGESGLTAVLEPFDFWGDTLELLGDLDGDGTPDLAVGHPNAGTGFISKGEVWVLFLNPDGSVREHTLIGEGMGGFEGALGTYDLFGLGLACPGDLDGDGVQDLVAGAPFDDDGLPQSGWTSHNRGALYVLFLRPDGTVRAQQKISDTEGQLDALLFDDEYNGYAVAPLGDLDGDGTPDVITGAPGATLGFGQAVTGGAMVLTLHAAEWADLGGGLGAPGAPPALGGVGTLVAGSSLRLELRGAPALQPTWVVAGASALMTPTLGGLLGPQPDVVFVGGVTDAQGRLAVGGHWPPGLAPSTSLWTQTWTPDAGDSGSWAASNTLQATSP